MKIAIILGTRPEIIKMSPLIRACRRRGLDYFILHTGQHYDYEMDGKFFEDLELEKPKYNLRVGTSSFRKQLGDMVKRISEILVKESVDIVYVQGDTTSVLAGALAAKRVGKKLGHHEAGLRSHDIGMIEETNRIITDQLSDYLFAPTEIALKNLNEEGIKETKTVLTGNTIVDALYQNLEISNRKISIIEDLGVEKNKYITATVHRAENVDIIGRLRGILEGLELVEKYFKMPIILPLHPRTVNKIKEFGLKIPDSIKIIKPLGYLEFLQVEANSKLVITDSGGVQEESCILKIPCLTVRDNTERPETVAAGLNILAGTKPEKILESAKFILAKEKNWVNPFGDGQASEKILDATIELFQKNKRSELSRNIKRPFQAFLGRFFKI